MSQSTTPLAPVAVAEDASVLMDRLARDERWLGYGYLGTRLEAADRGTWSYAPHAIAVRDELVVAEAARRGWSAEDLLGWANSRDGRYAGDILFGSAQTAAAGFAAVLRAGLFRKHEVEA